MKRAQSDRLVPATMVAAIALAVGGLWGPPAFAQSATAYAGEATAINFSGMHQPETAPIVLADTGPLPTAGGKLQASYGAYDLDNGVVRFSSASAAAFGGGDEAMAGATVNQLQVELQGSDGTVYTITADSVQSESTAVEASAGTQLEGKAQIENLALNGQPIAVTGQPNQTVTFDVWTLTINQQTTVNGTITTAGLFISMPGCLQGYVATSQAGMSGAAPCPEEPSCIQSNFNGTPIAAGNRIWFNSIVKVNGSGGSPATVVFDRSTVQFSVNGSLVTLTAPSAVIHFDAGATVATTVYDPNLDTWFTTVPANYSGEVFLSGFYLTVPPDFPRGLNPVTWCGDFSSSSSALSVQWKWAAAVYTQFSDDLNAEGAKPIEGSKESGYANSDHAGTPENYKAYVIGGARGGGGSNFTGSYSGTAAATVCPE